VTAKSGHGTAKKLRGSAGGVVWLSAIFGVDAGGGIFRA
jgi:hypothetical protein